LRLRPYTHDDEVSAREANEVMKNDGALLLLDLDDGMAWDQWLRRIDEHRRRLSLSVGLVPATQLVADVNGVIVVVQEFDSVSIRTSKGREVTLATGSCPRIVDVATPPRSCARPSSSREAKGWPAYS